MQLIVKFLCYFFVNTKISTKHFLYANNIRPVSNSKTKQTIRSVAPQILRNSLYPKNDKNKILTNISRHSKFRLIYTNKKLKMDIFNLKKYHFMLKIQYMNFIQIITASLFIFASSAQASPALDISKIQIDTDPSFTCEDGSPPKYIQTGNQPKDYYCGILGGFDSISIPIDESLVVAGPNTPNSEIASSAVQASNAIPEPSSIALFTLGLAGLVALRKRKS